MDSWLAGFVHGFFSTSKGRWKAGWKEANLRAGNDAKIWGGLFVTDPNKSFGGRVWELISRFTWQLPQTTGGFYTSHAHNTYGFWGGVESVDYAYGATVVRTRKSGWGAIAQGSFIVGDNRLRADASTSLFQHEYGHYIQSQRFGLFYYSEVGIPSLISASGRRTHNRHLVEQDANIRAFKYFSKHIEDFNWVDENGHQRTEWIHQRNPIIGYDWTMATNSPGNMEALRNSRLRLAWYDYLLLPTGIILPGLINALILR